MTAETITVCVCMRPCVCMFVHVCVYVFVHVYVYVLYSLLTNPTQPQTCSHKVICQAAGIRLLGF